MSASVCAAAAQGRVAPWIALAGLIATPVLASRSALPVGIQPETTALAVLLRLVAGVGGLALLAAGSRLPSLTSGCLAMVVAAAIGIFGFPLAVPLETVAITWAFFALAMAIDLFLPRLGAALAACWPLATVLVLVQYFSGSFRMHQWVVIALLIVGALFGALLPEHSRALSAPASGTALIALAWPEDVGLYQVLSLFVIGVLWQAVGLRVLAPQHESWATNASERLAHRLRQWRGAVAWGAAALLVATLLLVALLPRATQLAPAQAARLARLQTGTRQPRPVLITSAADSLYLLGHAWPVALASANPRPLDRLTALVEGQRLGAEIGLLRTVKDADEIAAIRRACSITSESLAVVTPLIRPGVNEGEIEDALVRAFAVHGATGVAFKSIVASGPNALLPHYDANDATLADGLVVIDIGCSVAGYASDLTRTFPVRGRWSEPQRKLLEVVLAAKAAAQRTLRPGARPHEVNEAARAVVRKAGLDAYWLHGVSHNVGLDVHDPNAPVLRAGMVVTVEPGLYVPAGSPIERGFWNLGVRVEDTCLITESGYEVLTRFPEAPGMLPPAGG